MDIGKRYLEIRRETPEEVTIVLAAKTRTPREVAEAIAAGATDIGENYVQEAEAARRELGGSADAVRWHMIGTLQTNKINRALQSCDVIQTIDSFGKAAAVNSRAEKQAKVIPVYIEINIGGEQAKSGVLPDQESVVKLASEMSRLAHLRVEGLMTMGPMTGDPEDSRPHFRKARKLFEAIARLDMPGIHMKTLSMGMSDTYRIAVDEGSTMVRLGTVVFGPRPPSA